MTATAQAPPIGEQRLYGLYEAIEVKGEPTEYVRVPEHMEEVYPAGEAIEAFHLDMTNAHLHGKTLVVRPLSDDEVAMLRMYMELSGRWERKLAST
jgi:hypothetical protein